MKKITLLVCVCLMSVMGFSVTRDTLSANNFLSKYPSGDEVPKAITVNEIGFSYEGIKYNANGSPTGWYKQQFIQFRKPTAQSTAGSITSTTDITNMTKVMVLAYGSDAQSFSVTFGEETPIEYNDASVTTSIENKALIHVAGSDEGESETIACKWYEFTNTNKAAKFTLTNGTANMNNFIYIVIERDNSSTGIDEVVEAPKAYKIIEDGQIVVVRNGVKYNAAGTVIGTVE